MNINEIIRHVEIQGVLSIIPIAVHLGSSVIDHANYNRSCVCIYRTSVCML